MLKEHCFLGFSLCFHWHGTGAAADEKPFIFGLLLVGPYNDHGWSQTHYEGGDRVSVLHLGRVIESMVRLFDTDEILKMMFGLGRTHHALRAARRP